MKGRKRAAEQKERAARGFGGFAGWQSARLAAAGKWAAPRLPVLIVLAFCLVFAFELGALEPGFAFQKTAVDNGNAGGSSYAYASGSSILFKMPHGDGMHALASFAGSGRAASVSYRVDDGTVNVTRIMVGGRVACAPCIPGEKYPINAAGGLDVAVFAKETGIAAPAADGLLKRAFFDKSTRTGIDALVEADFEGGWRSQDNAAMPSSFYGVDAPFHIHRVPIAASHLVLGQWPWGAYTFVSILPASAMYALLGVSHQYAYKLWEILIFFLPVAVFYLFSRKMPRGKDAIFLFASLIYLFLPSQGMLDGGGADLFMYGMTAHTLATSVSLLALFFAYEFSVEQKNARFWPALALFVLAAACNQRILVSLCIGMGALFALSLVVSQARRTALLGLACAAASAWLAAPFLLASGQVGSYAPLGGASTEGIGWAVWGFFQLGYFLLPLLFAAGGAAAILRKDTFLLFLFAASSLTFVFATSPDVNRLAPFLDGLRFMPSFFLPVFFVSGAGAFLVFELAASQAKRVGSRLGLDRLDSVVSFSLAVLMPFAVLFASTAIATMEQYHDEQSSLAAASEYSELAAAYGIAGDGCVFMQGRDDTSQYPIYEQGLERTVLTGLDSSGEIASAMAKARCKYLILGDAKWLKGGEGNTRWQEYEGFLEEAGFSEVAYGGSNRLFVLGGVLPAAKAESADARVDGYSFDYDRGSVQGECLAEKCALRIRQDALPYPIACGGVPGCSVRLGDGENALYVEGVPRGSFSVSLEPKQDWWLVPLVLAGLAVACACYAVVIWLLQGSKPEGKCR